MGRQLYLEDPYLKECEAKVKEVRDSRYIILDQTVFYPKGGGQPHDTGVIIKEEEVYQVTYVGKSSGETLHEVDRPGLNVDDMALCRIDWDRRYRLMRSHTSAHVLAAILCDRTGALITGNELTAEKIRFDFNLENFDREIFMSCIQEANRLFKKNIPVKTYELPREEALKIPGVIKMAEALPPAIPRLRIVEIEDVDRQADGGTHVHNLIEVGEIEFLKAENKGRNNRRIYYKLKP
ncbi:MAG: alanyl-tRNA editing protein AlaXM [Candidatus Bathyarchaeia archaeon]